MNWLELDSSQNF